MPTRVNRASVVLYAVAALVAALGFARLALVHSMCGYTPRRSTEFAMLLLKNGCIDFYLDMDRFPRALSELVVPNGSEKWDGRYLDSREIPKDGWGNPYIYVPPTDEGCWWGIISLGADGKPNGTEEDADIWCPGPAIGRGHQQAPTAAAGGAP